MPVCGSDTTMPAYTRGLSPLSEGNMATTGAGKKPAKAPAKKAPRKPPAADSDVGPRGPTGIPPAPRKIGEYHYYTPELGRRICERMSKGELLLQICRDPDMPDRNSVVGWCLEHPEFDALYLRAREALLDHWSEEIVTISEDGSNDWMEREIGKGRIPETVFRGEAVQRSRLRVDTRKWLLSKLRPETYGESQRIDLKGKLVMSEKEVDNQLAALLVNLIAGKKAE